MRKYYKVKRTIFEGNRKIYPDNYIWVQDPATITPLVHSGHLEGANILTPSACCKWCGGNEFWLNHLKLFKCQQCYSPSSFPDEQQQKVYDVFTLDNGKDDDAQGR